MDGDAKPYSTTRRKKRESSKPLVHPRAIRRTGERIYAHGLYKNAWLGMRSGISLRWLGQLLRSTCDLLAFADYAVPMKVNPVLNYTLIIRSQVEYSAATQRAVLRCILETPATGQRRGFSDVDALLIVLRAELLALQNQLIPPAQEEAEPEEAEPKLAIPPDRQR